MKMMTTAATVAAVLVSAGTAMAVSAPRTSAPVSPVSAHRGQYASNQNLLVSRRHVERAIDTLQRDAHDYGGHKERAVDDLGLARQYLDQALDFRQSQRRGGVTPPPGTPRTHPSFRPRVPSGRPIDGGINRSVDASGETNGSAGTDAGINDTGVNDTGANDTGNDNGENASENGNGFRGQRGSNESLQDVRAHVEAAIDALQRDRYDYGGYKERAIDRLQAARGELEAALDFVHRTGVRNGGQGQRVSDANLRFVDEHVRTAIVRLEGDRNDYGGHRAAAINDLQQARGFIAQALAYDNSHRGATGVAPNVPSVIPGAVNTVPSGVNTVPSGMVPAPGRGQGRSDQSLANARRDVETAMDALKRDAHDYGGFRVKAIGALQAAREQLLQALNFRHVQ